MNRAADVPGSIAAWPTKYGIWEMRTSCSKLCGDLWKLKFNGICKWVVRSPPACIYITKGSLTKEKWGKEYNIQASGLNYSNFLFNLPLFAFYLDQSTTEEAVFSLTLTEGRQEARSERIVWRKLQILACCSPKNGKKKFACWQSFPKLAFQLNSVIISRRQGRQASKQITHSLENAPKNLHFLSLQFI